MILIIKTNKSDDFQNNIGSHHSKITLHSVVAMKYLQSDPDLQLQYKGNTGTGWHVRNKLQQTEPAVNKLIGL